MRHHAQAVGIEYAGCTSGFLTGLGGDLPFPNVLLTSFTAMSDHATILTTGGDLLICGGLAMLAALGGVALWIGRWTEQTPNRG